MTMATAWVCAEVSMISGPLICKFACNNDPLRGDFRVQLRPPLTLCVSVLPFGPDRPGRAGGDGWGGQDRGATARLFRARPPDQGDRTHGFGGAPDGPQGHSQPQDLLHIPTR